MTEAPVQVRAGGEEGQAAVSEVPSLAPLAQPPRRLVYCVGMQSSGSTWLYNITRELMDADGGNLASVTMESAGELLDDRLHANRQWLLRAHNVETGLLRLMEMSQAHAVLSFRDPRDAIASYLKRFSAYVRGFVPACRDIMRNLSSGLTAAQELPSLPFFYEDRFFEDRNTILRLAEFLQVRVAPGTADALMARYSADAVRKLISRLSDTTSSRVHVDGFGHAMDPVTGFNASHMSDARVGKWQDVLDAPQQRIVRQTFAGYTALLAQRSTAIPAGLRVSFESSLFAPVDRLHGSCRPLDAASVSTGLGVRVLEHVYLPRRRWNLRVLTPELEPQRIMVCQNGQVLFAGGGERGNAFAFDNHLHDHALDVHVDAEPSDQPPPHALLEAVAA